MSRQTQEKSKKVHPNSLLPKFNQPENRLDILCPENLHFLLTHSTLQGHSFPQINPLDPGMQNLKIHQFIISCLQIVWFAKTVFQSRWVKNYEVEKFGDAYFVCTGACKVLLCAYKILLCMHMCIQYFTLYAHVHAKFYLVCTCANKILHCMCIHWILPSYISRRKWIWGWKMHVWKCKFSGHKILWHSLYENRVRLIDNMICDVTSKHVNKII